MSLLEPGVTGQKGLETDSCSHVVCAVCETPRVDVILSGASRFGDARPAGISGAGAAVSP